MVPFLIITGLTWIAGLILLHRGVGAAPRASEDPRGFRLESGGDLELEPAPVHVRTAQPTSWARETA
jgi:hypothetical protein